MSNPSYKMILRATSIMGAASAVNIVSAVIKMKVIALLLGPAGVGLLGLYQNIISTATTASALGLGTIGTRQVAEAETNGTPADRLAIRRALSFGALALAVTGASVFYLLRDIIATLVLADPYRGTDVGWLALAVGLTVLASSQSALLNGLRRLGDLARLQILSGLAAMMLGLPVIILWQERGLIILTIIGPLVSLLLGHFYAHRIVKPTATPTSIRKIIEQFHKMVALGAAFMAGTLITSLAQLAMRSQVQSQLGPDALGHFQAAWTISMTFSGFVLGAMITDYYPRLTGCIHDKNAACALINQQTEIALLLIGPAVIAIIAVAPWIIQILYSSNFAPAIGVLRWQIGGDILKILSWPVGIALLASGAGRLLIGTESAASVILTLTVLLGLPVFGITTTGLAHLTMYAAYLAFAYIAVYRLLGFRWTYRNKYHSAILMLSAGVTALICARPGIFGTAFGISISIALLIHAILRIKSIYHVRNSPNSENA